MKKGKIVLGIVITLCSILLLSGCGKTKLKNGEEVAVKINGTNITADDLYDTLREKYAKYILINEIDKTIFNKVYKNDKDIEKQVENQYEAYENQYAQEDKTFEEILQDYGYKNAKEFKDELKLNFQRDKAVEEYIKENITDKEIQEYYDNKYYAEISASHILISVTDEVSEEDALKKAKDLIKKLDNGDDFATLAKENSNDTGSAANGGDLGYFGKGQMVSEFEEAAFALKVDEYTKTPVKTTYGYHIILKTGEKEKAPLKEVKDEIKESIYKEKKEDSKIGEKTLDKIRKKYSLKFKDSKLKSIYKKYVEDATKTDEE